MVSDGDASVPEGDEFVRFLEDRVDDSLRAVRIYSLESHQSLYAREDVRQWASEKDVDAIVERARAELRERADQSWWFTHDELEGTVRLFHEVAIVNLLLSDERGVLVSLDVEVASRLHEFVHDCQRWLDGD